ncbi:MAG TPA: zinc ribbon domain-containing protein [bacterium]|nr:zinc ribbon domain-containing protein [bacterium]
MTSHPLYVLHYECTKCHTPYDVMWDSRREQEPPSQCPQCGSPVRRFVGSSYRAGTEKRPAAAMHAGHSRPERRTA